MARGMRKNVGRRGGGEKVVERGGNGGGRWEGRLRKVSRMIDKNGRVSGENGSPEEG